jgi:hypothetical protein
MNRRIAIGAIAGALAMTAWLAHAQQAAPDPTGTTVVVHGNKPGVKRDWIRAESRHFIVYSDTRREDVSALLSQLERFRHVLRSLSNMGGQDQDPKLTLYYLSDESQLRTVDPQAPDHAIGLYQACEDGVEGYAVHQAYRPKAGVTVLQQPEDGGLTYIFQAYARHFFAAHFPIRTPAWYIDGYAQYFSTVRFDGNAAIIGLPPQALARYVAGLESETYKAQMTYQDLLNDKDLFTLTETEQINADSSSAQARAAVGGSLASADFGNIDPQHQDERRQAEVATEYQARAWLMTHWLLSSHGNLDHLADYVSAVGHGENRLDAFHRVFSRSPAEMDDVLRDYLHHKAKLLRLTFTDMPDADVQFDDEPSAANHLLLDDAALRGCPSPAYGRALLADIQHEATQYPDSEFARIALARAEIGFGDPQKALPWLERQTGTLPGDFDAQYLLGRARLAAARTSGDSAAYDAAKVAFTRAARIDAASAVNAFWYYRAQVAATGQVAPDAAGAAVLAYKTAPEVDAYAVHAGLVYALAGDGANAFAALHTAADSPRPGPWTKTARDWIGRMKAGVSNEDLQAAIVAPIGAEPGKWHGQVEWTQAYQAVLGDLDLQTGQADLHRVMERFQVLKGSVKGGGAGTKAAPALGVRMPDDDND